MTKLLRNLNINTAVATAMIACALLVAALAVLRVVNTRTVDESLSTLNQINVAQLNQVSRATVLLNQARIHMEMSADYLDQGMRLVAESQMEGVEELLTRAQNRFDAFKNTPKTEMGQARAGEVESAFVKVIAGVRDQYVALQEQDLGSYSDIRQDLITPADDMDASLTDFTRYADERGAEVMAEYQTTTELFSYIGLAILVVTGLILVGIYFSLRSVVVKPLHNAVEKLQRIARADLSEKITAYGDNEVGKLFKAMRDMQQSLGKIVNDVRSSSNSVRVGSSEIARGNTDLSSRTEQQAASLEETATSMEQLTATVKQNADNARQASSLANDASSTATRGGDVMKQVTAKMQGITESSKQVADITGMIDSIAFQTNILALNASVEAARAGEQGRGFAVVAGEVRNLAGNSADAARQIKQLIESSTVEVNEGSALVEQASDTVREVVASVRRVTDIMDEISAASQEQSGGIEQVSQAVSQMDEVTQQNASLVEEASSAAASLEEQAKRLEEAVSVFSLNQDEGDGETIPMVAVRDDADDQVRPAPVARRNTPRLVTEPPRGERAEQTDRSDTQSGARPSASRRELATAEDDWEEF